MNEKDREHIDNYVDILVEKTNFKKVYTLLLKWRVLPVNLRAFEDDALKKRSDKENNKILYNVIKTQGKDAFQMLKKALHISNPEVLEQFDGRHWRISSEQWQCQPQVYDLRNGNIRGAYRIITFTHNRPGWEEEVNALEIMFDFLEYEGFSILDPSDSELDKLLTDFSNGSCYAGCYVIALMGHGLTTAGAEAVKLKNGSYKQINHILKKFLNAPALMNKPKIIILEVCRGSKESLNEVNSNIGNINKAFIAERAMGVNVAPVMLPGIKDTIMLRPCLPGYVAYRHWLIKELTDMVKEYAHRMDIEEIMIEVQNKFRSMRENRTGIHVDVSPQRYMIPCVNTYSFKKFYFVTEEKRSLRNTNQGEEQQEREQQGGGGEQQSQGE